MNAVEVSSDSLRDFELVEMSETLIPVDPQALGSVIKISFATGALSALALLAAPQAIIFSATVVSTAAAAASHVTGLAVPIIGSVALVAGLTLTR